MTPFDVIEGRAKWCVVEGDCREVLPELPVVDAVVTDPPYGIARVWSGGSGSGWGKAREEATTRNEWDEAAPDASLLRLLRGMAKVSVFWGGNYFDLPPSRGWFVWTKPERGFSLAEAELAWTSIDTVIRVFDGPRSDKDRTHPTQKPISLMLWCIEQATKPGDVVLDPFCGSGTTGVACLRLGRRFIGIEREPKYAAIARERLAAESQGLTLRDARAGQLSLLGGTT